MLVKTFGFAVHGINATKVTVEVNISPGVNFFLVGLPDSAVKESQQRVYAALKNNGYKIPGKQITVNMAPADIRKVMGENTLRVLREAERVARGLEAASPAFGRMRLRLKNAATSALLALRGEPFFQLAGVAFGSQQVDAVEMGRFAVGGV